MIICINKDICSLRIYKREPENDYCRSMGYLSKASPSDRFFVGQIEDKMLCMENEAVLKEYLEKLHPEDVVFITMEGCEYA